MNPTAERLWARVLAEIGRRGLLPLRPEPLTPREIADHCRATGGDVTVHRFVHEYYYPTTFGRTTGLLGEREAEALVAAFESGRKTADPAPPARTESATCRVCNHRSVPSSPG